MIRNNLKKLFLTERDYFENNYFDSGIVQGDGDSVNTYGYSEGIAKINVDNNNGAWFLYRQPNLKVGDIIEVECEIRTISGHYPDMRIYKNGFNNAGLLDSVPATQNEWEIVRHRHIVEEETNYYIGVGYIAGNDGHAEFRNFSINFKTTTKVDWININTAGDWTVYHDELNYPLQYRRVGDQVTVRGSLKQPTDVGNKLIAIFPENVYPSKFVYASALQKDGTDKLIVLHIKPDGKFEVVVGSIELEKQINFYFTYDID